MKSGRYDISEDYPVDSSSPPHKFSSIELATQVSDRWSSRSIGDYSTMKLTKMPKASALRIGWRNEHESDIDGSNEARISRSV